MFLAESDRAGFSAPLTGAGGRTVLRVRAHSDKITVDELQQLVCRAQSGDADAWEALYRLAYPALLGYARRRSARRDEADDAVSETFARAYGRIGGFHWEGAGFNSWLFGILRNVLLEAHRRDRRNDRRLMHSTDNDEDLLHDLLLGEEFGAVRAAFACLSAEDREVLELRVVGGLAADEVAAVLGKRAGAVRMAQSRALSRLRMELAKGGDNG